MADSTYSLFFGGRARNFIVHLPNGYSRYKKYPVVLNLHGGGGNSIQHLNMTNMNPEADNQGFIVVYPNGTGPLLFQSFTWNAQVCCGSALTSKVDDIGFLNKVMDFITNTFSTDGRFYMCGFSNGGIMTYYYANSLPIKGRVKAIACVEGCNPGLDRNPPPMPMIQFHGTNDSHIPYEGGYGADAIVDLNCISVENNINYWKKINNSNVDPIIDDNQYYTSYIFSPASWISKPVILYKIKGGGHTWAGGNPPPIDLGPLVEEVNVNKIMLNFFKGQK